MFDTELLDPGQAGRETSLLWDQEHQALNLAQHQCGPADDEIILVDDRSSSVSLPEMPLLGVLPGTGGLTRLTDKRKVRHDLADIFCTTSEGVRGQKAMDWRLVDHVAKSAQFAQAVRQRAQELAAASSRPAQATGVKLIPLERTQTDDAIDYEYVSIKIDRGGRNATLTVRAPKAAQPTNAAGIEAAGIKWWPLQMARELDDAILHLRTNETDIDTWILKSSGDPRAILACDATLAAQADHWLVRETAGLMRRTFARHDVSSRSMFAFIEQGSCFVGSLLEVALAADRIYMLALPEDPENAPKIGVSEMNFGRLPMLSALAALAVRATVQRATIDPGLIEDAIFGCGYPGGQPGATSAARPHRRRRRARNAMAVIVHNSSMVTVLGACLSGELNSAANRAKD